MHRSCRGGQSISVDRPRRRRIDTPRSRSDNLIPSSREETQGSRGQRRSTDSSGGVNFKGGTDHLWGWQHLQGEFRISGRGKNLETGLIGEKPSNSGLRVITDEITACRGNPVERPGYLAGGNKPPKKKIPWA